MILVHSDIRGFSENKLKLSPFDIGYNQQIIDSAFEELNRIASGREILLPTFNYDFTKTKVYNYLTDLPQVGRLPIAAVIRPEWQRSKTPVYSFASNTKRPDHFPRPFSENSVFNCLVETDGEIILKGVGFDRFTFIHHVEHVCGIPYRYEKSFRGELLHSNERTDVEVQFHVRPKGLFIDYDFDKIEEILIACGAAKRIDKNQIVVSARKSFTRISELIKENQLSLLSRESAQQVDEKINLIGRGFTLEDFE
jgi:aminoglycoside 3-N-acetyltransferase